ncbi:MAG: CsbD family protein [Alkalinema sp. CAN_BIN05]|nr:CsbD family protein [Alkalinema sp. CAN_BIN05]
MNINATAKAAAKTVESKVQDVVAKVTGDPEDQLSAKMKQAEANLSRATANAQNHLEYSSNVSLQDKARNALLNVEGKVQDTIGRLTDSPEDQAAGKAKQVVATARNVVSNARDKVNNAVKLRS